MKKTNTKAPFKMNILGFKLETTITEMSFWQIVILFGMGIIFILALIIFLRGYAIAGLSISDIIDKTSKLEILKIVKSRSP
jgi:hypothetical protein